jgi:hypothetical protein
VNLHTEMRLDFIKIVKGLIIVNEVSAYDFTYPHQQLNNPKVLV